MGGLFSKPKVPKQEPPARIPIEDDPQSREAARNKRNQLIASRGRQSTDLVDDRQGEKLGN